MWCEGVMYLTSPGSLTDIGLQLGSRPRWLSWVRRLTGDQDVAGWQHSFMEIDHEIFSTVILSLLCRPRWLSWVRRPTGDQEVAGSTPAEVGNIPSWRLIMKYFQQSFSPFR